MHVRDLGLPAAGSEPGKGGGCRQGLRKAPACGDQHLTQGVSGSCQDAGGPWPIFTPSAVPFPCRVCPWVHTPTHSREDLFLKSVHKETVIYVSILSNTPAGTPLSPRCRRHHQEVTLPWCVWSVRRGGGASRQVLALTCGGCGRAARCSP